MSDDDRWFDALAGKPVRGASAETALEAGLLRAAARRSAARHAPATAVEDEQQLLQALQAAAPAVDRGAQGCMGCARRRERLLAWLRGLGRPAPAFATLAVALVLAAGWAWLPALSPTPLSDGPLRGAPGVDAQVLAAADPLEARNALADRLTAAGATVTRYDRLGRHGLQARLPQPVPEALGVLLRADGLALPVDGELRLEFEARVP